MSWGEFKRSAMRLSRKVYGKSLPNIERERQANRDWRERLARV